MRAFGRSTRPHFHLAHESSMTLSALTDETHWILGSGAQVNISGEGSWHQEQSGLRLMGQASWRSALSEGIRFDGNSVDRCAAGLCLD